MVRPQFCPPATLTFAPLERMTVRDGGNVSTVHHAYVGVWDNADDEKGGVPIVKGAAVKDIGPPGMQKRHLRVTGNMYVGRYSCRDAVNALATDPDDSLFVNGTCTQHPSEWVRMKDSHPDVYDAKDLRPTKFDAKRKQNGTNVFVRGNAGVSRTAKIAATLFLFVRSSC